MNLFDRSRMLAKLSATARSLPGENATDWYRIRNAAGDNGQPAEVDLYAEIGWFGKTAQDFMDELRGITASAINLRVNSPGGEIFDGMAIHNLLRSHPANVTAYVDSLAASIASVIVMGADRVVMQPHSQMMIHDASGGCLGNAADMRDMADLLDRQSDNIAGVYAEKAGGQVRSWRNRMKDETWYTADEAVAAGLADEVASTKRKPTPMPGPGEPNPGEEEEEGDGDEDRLTRNRFDLSIYQLVGMFRYAGRDYAPAPELANRAGHRSRSNVPAVVDTAVPVHHTAASDETWDAGENEKDLDSPMTLATAKAMYAWYDGDQVEDGKIVKAACKFPHHMVEDGEPDEANLDACRNGLARLSQSDVPEGEQDAVRKHLQAHLDDADPDGDGDVDDQATNAKQKTPEPDEDGDGGDDDDDDEPTPPKKRRATNVAATAADPESAVSDAQPAQVAPSDDPDRLSDGAEPQGVEPAQPDATEGEWDASVAHLTTDEHATWLTQVAHLTSSRASARHRTTVEQEAPCRH